MPIDLSALGTEYGPSERAWTSKDAILYALGVGAGVDELEFTTENSTGITQRVLPTFATVLGGGAGAGMRSWLGTFNPAMLVHAEQGVEVFGPIPVEGTVMTRGKITGIYDKGSGALVTTESLSDDGAGQPLFRLTASIFIRGEGSFGGDRGPSGPKNVAPGRDPDEVVSYQTLPQQALIYRLSGDRNPLHSDPKFAELAGFDRPIIHGLCTYGFTGRALLHALCGSDPLRFKSMEGRFTKPAWPGDTLTIKMWIDGSEALFRTETEKGEIVIDHGRFVFE